MCLIRGRIFLSDMVGLGPLYQTRVYKEMEFPMYVIEFRIPVYRNVDTVKIKCIICLRSKF